MVPKLEELSDVHDVTGQYRSSISSYDERTDRGDGQTTRIFIGATKDYFERRVENI
jgi:hypothetical protein